jgi:transposase
MGKRKFQLTETETCQLQANQQGTHCQRTCLRLQAVIWYGSGRSLPEIQDRLRCSRFSVLHWCQLYHQGGPAALRCKWQGGNNARLTRAQMVDLCARMKAQTPRSIFGDQAAAADGLQWTVEDLHIALKQYGVVYKSKSSYYRLLKKCVELQEQLDPVEVQLSKV